MEKPKNEDKMEENTINTDETAESAVLDAETNAAGYMLAEQDLADALNNGKVAAAYEMLTKEVTELERPAFDRSGHDWVR